MTAAIILAALVLAFAAYVLAESKLASGGGYKGGKR